MISLKRVSTSLARARSPFAGCGGTKLAFSKLNALLCDLACLLDGILVHGASLAGVLVGSSGVLDCLLVFNLGLFSWHAKRLKLRFSRPGLPGLPFTTNVARGIQFFSAMLFRAST